MAEAYGRLGALLNEWEAVKPTPGFEARVRQAVESEQAGRARPSFWGFGWVRGLAVAAAGIFLLVGAVWFLHAPRGGGAPARLAARQPQPAVRRQARNQVTNLTPRPARASASATAHVAVPDMNSPGAWGSDASDDQALEDYDVAANFDLLSELPKGEPRVAN
jgi:hypothetical protein